MHLEQLSFLPTLGDVYEVIPCTEEAKDSIEKAGIREQ